MILVSNDAAQTVAAGESATFSVLRQTGGRCNPPSEIFANNAINLRAGGLYEIGFHANVTGADTTALQLSLQFGGTTLPETTTIYTPATALAVGNVSSTTFVGTFPFAPNQSFTVTLTNTGTTAITISPNALMYARRVG